MSPKGKKILAEHPDATPYELQMTHGLSQGDFDELVAIQDQKATNILKAGVPKLSPNAHLAIPVTTVFQPHRDGEATQLTLRGKRGSGNGTLMDAGRARKMKAKYPDDYEII